jgi:D-3-phosphoglycerate dehydrogenase
MYQVILSPHVAWYSEESQFELRKRIAQNIGKTLHGLLPQGLVNQELKGRFRIS